MVKAERLRLARLHRLERIRAMAKQAALAEAAEAESTLAHLRALSQRTERLAESYEGPSGAATGWGLRQWGSFAKGLRHVHAATLRDTEHARGVADAKQSELGQAERSRQAVEDRADRQARAIARSRIAPQIGARRKSGTGLE